MKRRRTAIRSVLILVLATQLTVFTPTTNAGFTTSKCTGTLTATAGTLTIVKAISFIVFGSLTSFSLSYSAVIQGITYSVSANGTCVPN
jgi:hypothetical protein